MYIILVARHSYGSACLYLKYMSAYLSLRIYTHIKCMVYACAFPFLFACTSYIYIHHTYNKKSRVTYTILYNCCCVIITYFNTIYGCSLYRQLSCVHIYIYIPFVVVRSFARSLVRSFTRARTHHYIFVYMYIVIKERPVNVFVLFGRP